MLVVADLNVHWMDMWKGGTSRWMRNSKNAKLFVKLQRSFQVAWDMNCDTINLAVVHNILELFALTLLIKSLKEILYHDNAACF